MKNIKYLSSCVGIFMLLGCQGVSTHVSEIQSIDSDREVLVNLALQEIFEKHGVNTAGIAVIKGGQLDWSGYFGQQNADARANKDTLFNVGSITKTITAETMLRLASTGDIDFDEAMSDYWIDPDLRGSPVVHRLTARMALSHTTGFPNWRFLTKENTLAFNATPGERFGYSGEGVLYASRYVEEKLNVSFLALVEETLFKPLGISHAFMFVDPDNFSRIARPLDAEQRYYGHYCYPSGYCRSSADYSVSGDMVITVEDYTTFFIFAMNNTGLTPTLAEDKVRLQGVEVDADNIDCSLSQTALCPIRLGYGLGWNITELVGDKVIGHRGSDWSLATLAYYYEGSKDGLVIFLNAPNRAGILAMVDVLQLLDPKSPELHGYKLRALRN